MKTKEMLISFLRNADDWELSRACDAAPCAGILCRDCPFSSQMNAQLAAEDIQKGLADET